MSRIFHVLLFLTLPMLAQAESYDRPETTAEVLAAMQAEIARSGRIDEVVNQGGALEIFVAGESRGILNPDNLFYEMRKANSNAERGDMVARHIRVMLDNLLSDDERKLSAATLDRVMPVLRYRGYATGVEGVTLLERDFSPGLVIHYVIDSPESVSMISVDDLTASGLDQSALMEAAATNLAARRDNLGIGGEGLFYLELDGYYESSFVLDADLWQQIEAQIGPVLMALPSRDVVIFGPAEIDDVRAALVDLARQISDENGGITSAELFRFSGDGWELAGR